MPKDKQERKRSLVETFLNEIFGNFDTWSWMMMTEHEEFKKRVEKYLETHPNPLPEEDKVVLDMLLKEKKKNG